MKSLLGGVFVSAFLFGTIAAQAGTIQITASGEASVDAEFVRLGVTVTSKCYKTSVDAKNANAALAKDVREVMAPFAEASERAGIKDPFTEVGGQFTRQDEFDRRGSERPVLLCKNGWRTSKSLALKLNDLETLPEVQDTILALVDKHSEQPSAKEPQTWANWSSPRPDATKATREQLALDALKDAKTNAYKKLGVLVEACGLVEAKLIAVGAPAQSPGYDGGFPKARAASRESVADIGSVSSGFSFGQISQYVTETFTFEFAGGSVEQCLAKTK